MNLLGYLFAAYSLVWFGLFVYVFSLSKREKSLADEIVVLKELVAKRTADRK